MDSTFYDVKESTLSNVAHRWWNTKDFHDTSRVGLNTAGGCAGALFSTSSEMVQWYNALFDGKVISRVSMNELTNFAGYNNASAQYGLGLGRDITQGYKYWGRGGSTWGYRSKMIYDSGLKVVVCGLTNSYPSGMESVTFLLYRAVVNHILGCSGNINGTTSVCAGTKSVTYTVPPIPKASSYVWALPLGATGTSATNSIVVDFGSNAVSGEILVSGVNSFGPGGSTKIMITVKPNPSKPIITQNLNTLSSSASSGNQWHNALGPINGATNASYVITASGDYYTLVNVQGCSSDTSNILHPLYTGLSHSFLNQENQKIAMYPNPANNVLQIKTNLLYKGKASLNFYDVLGALVKSVILEETQKQVDIRDLKDGFYLIEISAENYQGRQKLRVQSD